ncbi:hypothetical protein CANCADRAFT_28961 [Tortispora caseinolytica NRRL Y-17796]|uniref:STAS domain-containing protein n=1 Tax=Tortispora caseinolytica NRRL Y-17796 TaxID=767744 RepID=A0A1E4TCK6_9ASCO|nr:hypothetical protein CANCADRAFT_28961 [Tortispora caseinolytica NRRL Y-17796]
MTVKQKLQAKWDATRQAFRWDRDQYIADPTNAVDFNTLYGKETEYRDFVAPVVGTDDYVYEHFNHPLRRIGNYFSLLFPIFQWIYRYNTQWLIGDLIAGISVGCVVVPQAMSYAQLALLPAEYGLYSSFVGVMIYCFFATSKDVTIGPVAVMSLQVSRVITRVQNEYPGEFTGPQIATALALLCGAITAGIGLIRIGFIVEFISLPAVAGFMSGSAFTILTGQVPELFGINKLFDTRRSAYLVVIDTLKNLGHSNLNAAWGLVSLFALYLLKYIASYGERHSKKYGRAFFYLSVMRIAIVIVFATLFAYLTCRNEYWHSNDTGTSPKYPLSLIMKVPYGLQEVGVPNFSRKLIDAILPDLPVSTIILLLEHIAIAKSFGRLNNYKIVPDQELIAIGVTNLIGVFFNAYPATGSFSRSALKSKCGVRTPLAGIFTGLVVLLGLYALTTVFYWIPKAALSAVIIHAVADLIAPPQQLLHFYRVSPMDAVIFLVCVFLTVFTTIEIGIYFAIACSVAVLLFRVAKPSGDFLGIVKLTEVRYAPRNSAEEIVEKSSDYSERPDSVSSDTTAASEDNVIQTVEGKQDYGSTWDDQKENQAYIVQERTTYVPLSHRMLNPDINVEDPPEGILIYRLNEGLTYPNASRHNDVIMDEVRKKFRPGTKTLYKTLGDRPWNDHGPRKIAPIDETQDNRPLLRALILDFSGVATVDSTGVQTLIDTQNQLDRYSGTEIEIHFAGIVSPWIRRSLIAAGFGRGVPRHITQMIGTNYDIESAQFVGPVVSSDTPFFHIEIPIF